MGQSETNIINGLWVGKSLSKLELLTIHSFLAHGYDFRLWVYDDLRTRVPEKTILTDANEIISRDKVFSYKHRNEYGHGMGSYAGFSDIFRYKLLYERGGWWSDMDITCLKKITCSAPYYFRPHHELPVVGNLMKCPKGSELMQLCYKKSIEIVNEDNTDWHKPIRILNENIKRLGLNQYITEKESNFDDWFETKKYIWRDHSIPDSWAFIHWQNEVWRYKKVSKTKFYYRSALAQLMAEYGLIEMPNDNWSQLSNSFKYHPLVRILTGKF